MLDRALSVRALLFCLLFVSGMCRAWGTLVVVIPTSEGVVLAADSRITLRRQFVDGVNKIRLVSGRQDLAFVLTGQSEFLPVLPDDATAQELRDAWERGPRQFSGQGVVEKFLASQPPAPLDAQILVSLGRRLSVSLVDALRSRMDGRLFYGQQLFRAVIAQYDSTTATTRIGSLRVDLSERGIPNIRDIELDTVAGRDSKIALIFGEQRYFEENVMRGFGQRYIAGEAREIWGSGGRVRDFTALSAATVARSWIRATAKMTEIIPITNGVGGPLKLFLLNGTPQMRELREE